MTLSEIQENKEQYEDYLMHYGVRGMKWGQRKYTNKYDGSLSSRGLKKQAKLQAATNKARTKLQKAQASGNNFRVNRAARKYAIKNINEKAFDASFNKNSNLSSRDKKRYNDAHTYRRGQMVANGIGYYGGNILGARIASRIYQNSARGDAHKKAHDSVIREYAKKYGSSKNRR